MNKIINIFIQDENYELEMVIKKVAENEIAKAKELTRESRYEWPHDDTHNGGQINAKKLYFRPNFQNYCPV